jgi:hypothetical protein
VPAEILNFTCHSFQLTVFNPTAANGNISTRLGKSHGNCLSDPSLTSGYKGYFPCQRKYGHRHRLFSFFASR